MRKRRDCRCGTRASDGTQPVYGIARRAAVSNNARMATLRWYAPVWLLVFALLSPSAVMSQSPPHDEPPIDPQTGRVRNFGVGDLAPRFHPEAWVRGEPVERLERGTIYAVWFFATWSDKSQAALQSITNLHSTFRDKGVVVLGVSLWELTKPPPQGTTCLERLCAFVQSRNNDFPYAVAYDGDEGEMAQTWMRAGDRKGIPAMFIIDREGRVAWMGHPLDRDAPPAKVIEGLLDGTYDVRTATERARQEAADLERARRLDRGYLKAVERGEGETARQLLDELLQIRPREFISRVPEVFRLLAVENGEARRAYEWLAGPVLDLIREDPVILNNLAWMIATDEKLTERNLDLAIRLAEMSAAVSDRRLAYVLDTLARVHFVRGEIDLAIRVQEEAVRIAKPNEQEQYRSVLDEYQARRKR
jgi:hypothetical protein